MKTFSYVTLTVPLTETVGSGNDQISPSCAQEATPMAAASEQEILDQLHQAFFESAGVPSQPRSMTHLTDFGACLSTLKDNLLAMPGITNGEVSILELSVSRLERWATDIERASKGQSPIQDRFSSEDNRRLCLLIAVQKVEMAIMRTKRALIEGASISPLGAPQLNKLTDMIQCLSTCVKPVSVSVTALLANH